MPNYVCPLGDEHCDTLTKVIDRTKKDMELAQDCIDCGWPAEDMLEENKRMHELASKTKAKFFPHKP